MGSTRIKPSLNSYLQIEQVCKIDDIRHDEKFDWATYHCHFSWSGDPKNTLYVATRRLDLNDTVAVLGAGVVPRFDERLVLTKPGGSVAQFVSAIDIPRDWANSGCPRPHWAMVYRLRAPPSMAHTAKANIAGRG